MNSITPLIALRLTWIALCLLTLLGASLGAKILGFGWFAGVAILAAAFLKVWLILQQFMELRLMPRAWKIAFALWFATLFVLMTLAYYGWLFPAAV